MKVLMPEKQLELDVDEVIISQFTEIFERNISFDGLTERYPGQTFTLITGNMPKSLQEDIESIIKKYCNH
jgi:hypothetical protein